MSIRLDEQRINALLKGSLGTVLEEPRLGYVYVADDGTTPAETSHGVGWCSVRINDNAEYTAVKIAPGLRAYLRDGLAVRLERERDGTLYIAAIDRVEGFEQLGGADPAQTIGTHDHQDSLNGGTLDTAAIATGQLLLERGGTEADLSATGGANQFLKQSSAGAVVTVGTIAAADITTALTTPPAIGGTTPAAGRFTSVALAASTELTIASGAVTVTQSYHRIDTEADGATDDLVTINGAGDSLNRVVIRAENTGRTVVLKTSGNIATPNAADVTLDETYKVVELVYDSTLSKWQVIGIIGAGSGGSISITDNTTTVAAADSIEFNPTFFDVIDNGSGDAEVNFIAAAAVLPYTATTSADWPGTDPDDVGEGLDTLADRVTVIESGGIGGGGIVSAPPSICEGRLTLESGVALSTTDQTAKTSLYFTPINGNKIGLYDGAAWAIYNFTERTLSLSGYTADKNYDIWLYNNSGTLTLDSTVWTNDTTRATALTTQDGVLVKTGDTTRRYIGTIRITASTGQCEDSVSKRYVWNNLNRKKRPLKVTEGTNTWSANGGASWRYANNSDVNRVFVVCGLNEDIVEAVTLFAGSGSSSAASMSIGLDNGTASVAQLVGEINSAAFVTSASFYRGYIGIGYHYLSWIEYDRAGTVTLHGDGGNANMQCGLLAEVWA